MDFPRMCRELRIASGLKIRQVAELLNMKSYQNVEYNNHKTIRVERVRSLIRIYKLDAADSARFIAAWEELPTSKYNQRMAPIRAKQSAVRSKAKGYDAAWRVAVESFGMVAGIMFDEQWSEEKCRSLCACDKSPGAHPPTANHPSLRCEFCNALEFLGMPEGWTDLETVTAKLADHQDAMDGVTGLERQ